MGALHLCVAGASLSNGNRGVEALGRSVLNMIDVLAPGSTVSVFDDGWGIRRERSVRYPSTDVEFVGVRTSRRWYRPESWTHIQAAQVIGGRMVPGAVNPAARRIARAAAVLDVSGGDSFTDMYGPHRLASVCAPKEAAIRARRPLVLLPQTYGPFDTDQGRRTARRLIRSAHLAYARDPESYERLVDLAGSDADASRLRGGTDLAFALRAQRPDSRIADHVEATADAGLLVGVNISGLLRDAMQGRQRFGLAGDYIQTLTDLTMQLVDAGARVMAAPHVNVPGGGGESDAAAITEMLERMPQSARDAVLVLPSHLDAAEVKWCVARCAWFVGSRMHSTIAALSSQVPAFGYAYSIKTRGVFQTCGMDAHVLDARSTTGPDAVTAMLAAFEARERTRGELAATVPPVIERAHEQVVTILTDVFGWQNAPESLDAIA